MRPSLFYLTCADEEEADKISALLLDRKLVVCVKKVTVESSYRWKGRVERSKELLLIMDSYEELFEEAEDEIKKIHSYDVFVFVATPVNRQSDGVGSWFKAELKSA